MADKEQMKSGVFDSFIAGIKNLKAGTLIDSAKIYLSNEDNAKAINDIFGSIPAFLFAFGEARKNEIPMADLKAIAKSFSPFFLNNADKFLCRLQNTDDAASFYHCNVFKQVDARNQPQPIRFPNGSLSYIGARTHRGKTTALISMAIDALNQGKRVYFFTNEESTNQIIMRMAKSMLYADFADPKRPNDFFKYDEEKHNFTLVDDSIVDFTLYANATFKNPANETNGTPLQKGIWQSFRKVESLMKAEKFTIVDCFAHKSFEDLESSLRMLDDGEVALIDYIQHIRRPPESSAQRELANASHRIADAAIECNSVIIAGAQLGRDAVDKKNPNAPDELGETLFRECGDLEQDAHLIIQIGWQPLPDGMRDEYGNTNSKFYGVLKQREHEADNHQYRILDNARFSLYDCMIDDDLVFFKPKEFSKVGAKSTAKQAQPFQQKECFGNNVWDI